MPSLVDIAAVGSALGQWTQSGRQKDPTLQKALATPKYVDKTLFLL
jgi:hypothetical protein